MPASTITFTDKSNSRSLPTVATENKVSASDMNQIKTVVNANAVLLDTNTSNISTNASGISSNLSAITPTTSNSNTINLSNRAGIGHETAGGAAMPDLTFTIGDDPAPKQFGFAVIRSNASSAPIIYGSTALNDFDTNYSAGAENRILVWAFDASTVFHQLIG